MFYQVQPMSANHPDPHLSQISTLWSTVEQAHGQNAQAVILARQRLLNRYGGAVKRYLTGALRNVEVAEELTQEFALRFMDGKYQGADRKRGRFRNFVRGVLAHLIADHYRRQQAQPRALPLEPENVPGRDRDPADPDPLFVESWRHALLGRAWQALADLEAQTGQPFHTVLRLRVDQPDLRSAAMAEQLSAKLGKPVSAAGLRQTLHRARDRFAELLLDEVVQTLGTSDEEDVEQELIELDLLPYCRDTLDRRRGSKKPPATAEHSGEEANR
jgi:RNA polymerase sigma-70 factor (ECF subfamily)